MTKLTGLRLNGKTIGVRLTLRNGAECDMDVDTYRQLGHDPDALPFTQLIPYADVFATEDEIEMGMFVEEFDGDHDVLTALNVFVSLSGKLIKEKDLSPADARKWGKKKIEVQKHINYVLPRMWHEEFLAFYLTHFTGNVNIYNFIEDYQADAFKSYFRWRSKEIFDSSGRSKKFIVKQGKETALLQLMGKADDWRYDGTVDTGYMGGGYCDLGHMLRYEHYAFSPKLNKTVVFGATCVSDFFMVDPVVIKTIIRAQEELLMELRALVFVLKTGKISGPTAQFKDIHSVLSLCEKRSDYWSSIRQSGNVTKILLFDSELEHLRRLKESGKVAQIKAFVRAGLPLTTYLRAGYSKVEEIVHTLKRLVPE